MDYIITEKKTNKYNEIVYYEKNKLIIREISKYDYDIQTINLQIKNDRLLNSINKTERILEIFEYKFKYYIFYEV